MLLTGIVLCGVISLILLHLWKSVANYDHLPSGPKGIPIFGNLLQLRKSPYLKFSEWATQHGKLFSLRFGPKQVLIVNNMRTIKEIFGTLQSTGRAQNINILNEIDFGMNSQGSLWQEQRRFCVKAIKDLGFGNASFLDSLILEKVDDVCSWIDRKIQAGLNNDVHFGKILLQATSNTIWAFTTGERIPSENCKIADVIENWFLALNSAAKRGLIFVPWLRRIAPEISGYNHYVKANQDMYDLIADYVAKQKLAIKNSELRNTLLPTNLIRAYLEQVEKSNSPNDSFYGTKGEKHCIHSVSLLLLGGPDTVANTLHWLICYMVAFPNVLKKVQQEIDETVGTDRDPTLADRQRMPFTDAVIMESLRFCSLAPFGVLHELSDQVRYENYTLPKGLLLIANIYHANRDPQIWHKPEEFLPERFITEDEAKRKALRNSLATFQEGKRKCPGEQLGKDMLFLFAAKLCQKYDFFPGQGIDKSKYLSPVVGYLLLPPELGIVVKPRP